MLPEPSPRAPESRSRREAWAVAGIAFVVVLLVHREVLHDPPYWDALLGVFPQATWQARSGLDSLRLLREQAGYVQGGACVYPFSALPPLVALLERAVPEPATRFAILHVATFAATGLAAGAVFRLARPFGRAVAWLAAAAFLAQPGVRALACQIGLEMPLVAASAAGIAALAERRWKASFAWCAAALLVKPTGVFVAAAATAYLLARTFAPRIAGPAGPRERRWLAAHALLLAAFGAQIVVIHAFERAPGGAAPFAGLVPLATKRAWTVPEFGLGLVLLAVLGAFAWRRRERGASVPPAVLVPALALVAYLGLLAQWGNVLPRYFVTGYPPLLALLAAALTARAPRGVAPAALAALAVFGLLNARGACHPDRPGAFSEPSGAEPLAATDGWLLERSLRFRDGLALDLQIARFAAERTDTAFVAPWPIQHALLEPALGYVDRPLDVACAETPVAWTARPAPRVAQLQATGREVLWILTPNGFAGEASRPRPGDVVVATFQVGTLRAFAVRRARFP